MTDRPSPASVAWVALVAAIGAFAWRGAIELPLDGEDLAILARVARGEDASPHVFRPLSDLWIAGTYALFGAESALPFQLGSIVLHAASIGLVFALARALDPRPAFAATAAVLFGVGAGVADSVCWVSAGNRLLSSVFGLAALVALLALPRRPVSSAVALALAFGAQLASNEEAYGTAALALPVLLAYALAFRRSAPRVTAASAGAALALVAGLGYHFLGLRQATGDAILEGGLGGALASGAVRHSVETRLATILAGLGLPGAAGGVALALALGAALARGWRGALLWLWLLASLVPFALSAPSGYRFHPSQAPVAVLLAVLAFGALDLARRGLAGPRASAGAFALVAALALAGSSAPRVERVRAWARARSEIAALRETVREAAERAPDRMPVSVNLDPYTRGLLVFEYRLPDAAPTPEVAFLDAPTGYVDPGPWPEGPAIGRRCDGTYGEIAPASYLEGRPRVEAMRLYHRARAVASLDEALDALASGEVDVTAEAVVEAPAERLAGLGGGRDGDYELAELAPEFRDAATLSMTRTVRVRAPGPVLLAIQEPWMYSGFWIQPRSNALTVGLRERRVLVCEARIEDGAGRSLPVWFLNARATGVLVPAGEHEIRLRWRIATPGELY